MYITKTATYFPNEPISNDEMEEFLGLINKSPSKSKRIVYAITGLKTVFTPWTNKVRPPTRMQK
jgi:3-oxoacyl-[acyl-carrier-protein] synthase-3